MEIDENSNTILQVQGIVKDFPGQRALDEVNFDVCAGEIHALIGENGAGKSTLIKIIAGMHRADQGEILIDGDRQRIASPKDSQALGLAFIHQDLNLVPHLSAAENILLGMYPLSRLKLVYLSRMVKKVEEIPDALPMDIDLRTPAKNLSVIQQWKVAINRALGLQSRIIFMDEPTSSLTHDEVNELFRSIEHLKRMGKAIVYVSHRMEEIFRIANRVTVIKDAKKVGTVNVRETGPAEIYKMMLGRELKDVFPQKYESGEGVCLEVRNLTRKGAIQDVTFKLNRGEILGIAGLVGAGRTELARLIFGADKKDEGEIHVAGKKVNIKSPVDAIRNGIALIPEERRIDGLVLQMDLKQNITLASLPKMMRWQSVPVLSAAKELRLAQPLVESISITPSRLNQVVEYLSGGNQQKVVLAKWLCQNAKILIFDEPTKGIDVGAKFAIHQLITHLAKDGVGIILISSDLPEVVALSHRILVMERGIIKTDLKNHEINLQSVLELCLERQARPEGAAGSESDSAVMSANQVNEW